MVRKKRVDQTAILIKHLESGICSLEYYIQLLDTRLDSELALGNHWLQLSTKFGTFMDNYVFIYELSKEING